MSDFLTKTNKSCQREQNVYIYSMIRVLKIARKEAKNDKK